MAVLSHRWDLSGVYTLRDPELSKRLCGPDGGGAAPPPSKRRRTSQAGRGSAAGPTAAAERPAGERWDDVQQLRQLRRAAVEQAVRAVRQLWDTTTVGAAAVSEAVSFAQSMDEGYRQSEEYKQSAAYKTLRQTDKELCRLVGDSKEDQVRVRRVARALRDLQALPPEQLWSETNAYVRRVLELEPPPQLLETEPGALLRIAQERLREAMQMTEVLRTGVDADGGVAIFRRARKDFSDIVAPHVDSFDWAAGDGLEQVVAELRSGWNLTHALAMPFRYALTLDGGGAAAAAAVEEVLDTHSTLATAPGDGQGRDWGRAGNADAPAWILRLAQPEAKKRKQAQEPEDPERQVRSLRAALAAAAAAQGGGEPRLWRICARVQIERAVVGWDHDDGPVATPGGRLVVQRIFRRWVQTFVSAGDAEDKERRRGLVAAWLPWLWPDSGEWGPAPSAAPAPAHWADETLCAKSVLPTDPGLPTGGVGGLRELWKVMVSDPGSPLHPQSCRLLKSTYQLPLLVQTSFGLAYGPELGTPVGPAAVEWVLAGWVPIMLRSGVCQLRGADRQRMAHVFREEEREPGGYFLIRGNERALRLLVVARGNYPITIERDSFERKSQSHTKRCVMLRSVRPSGLACPNYLYALKSGGVVYSFSRGRTFGVSLTKVLMAVNEELDPAELAQMLRVGTAKGEQIAAAFMHDLLNHQQLGQAEVKEDFGGARRGFPSCAAHWQELLGRELCRYSSQVRIQFLGLLQLGAPAGLGDPEGDAVRAQAEERAAAYRRVGLWVLREEVLPHLNDPGVAPLEGASGELRRKLHCLLVSARKLFMFQAATDGKRMQDGEDALMNQEALTPGQAWLHCVGDSLVACARECRRCVYGLGYLGVGARRKSKGDEQKEGEGEQGRRLDGLDSPVGAAAVLPTGKQLAELAGGGGRDGLRLQRLFAAAIFWTFWTPSGSRQKQEGAPEKRGRRWLASERPRFDDRLSSCPELGLGQELEKASKRQKGPQQVQDSVPPCDAVTRILATGNYTRGLAAATGCRLEQRTGWSVTVERLGIFRFLENFRALHRGKTIAEMRSTTPRRYQMDGWGFLCIVHTPDGGLCGVLNHMTHQAVVAQRLPPRPAAGEQDRSRVALRKRLLKLLRSESASGCFREGSEGLRMMAHGSPWWCESGGGKRWIPVTLDGELLGALSVDGLKCSQHCSRPEEALGDKLRRARCGGGPLAPWPDLETVDVDPGWVETAEAQTGVTRDVDERIDPREAPRIAPGLHMFSGGGRLMRPARFAGGAEASGTVRVGTLEQVFLDIAATHRDIGEHGDHDPGVKALIQLPQFRFVESCTTSGLSVTASLIPYFEMNCSPRNLFQCGMAKQTMGSCFHSLAARGDNKLYHNLHTSAALLRTDNQHLFRLDDYPNGHNVVLGVAACTGFDMEDAIIFNQTSIERGMFGGAVYFSHIYDASDYKDPSRRRVFFTITPERGQICRRGDPIITTSGGFSEQWPPKGHPELSRMPGRVHDTEVLASTSGGVPTRLRVIFRVPRIPTVGDKFASRHGQKGTVPLVVPQYDMPFASDGLVPDVIINPHAFPSRMTVGMLLEMIAAKYGAIEGSYPDATAWSEISEKPVHADRIGELLTRHGYARSGAQLLTNGATGETIQAEIFIGICYYQRLRHMVDDKFQAREAATLTKTDPLTGQPIGGRKKGGGIKIGEMERDAILAHGGRNIGEDRMLRSSDIGLQRLCAMCGATPCSCGQDATQYRWAPGVTEYMIYQFRTMGVMYRHLPRQALAGRDPAAAQGPF